MNSKEIAFGSVGGQIVAAMHCTLRVGLGALLAIVSISGLARAAEPPRDADNLVRAVKVLPDKAPDSSTLKAMVDSVYSQIPGWAWRGVHVPGHNMSEAKYDGTWHWRAPGTNWPRPRKVGPSKTR